MFGQTYSPPDLGVIALLVFFEGLLSIDNALVLALLARRLPEGSAGESADLWAWWALSYSASS